MNIPAQIRTADAARSFLTEAAPSLLEPFNGADSYSYDYHQIGCARCGGSGIYSQHHGVCYDCGGNPAPNRIVKKTVKVLDVARKFARKARQSAKITAARVEFLAAHEGLEAALEANHPILNDLGHRLGRTGSLSEKQIALAIKIARELVTKAEEREEEVKAAAPTGRQEIEGECLGTKESFGAYGTTLRMTVKVTNEDGSVWLANGTCPASLMDGETLRGARVRFTATLTASDKPEFAFFKRPSKAVRVAVEVPAETIEDAVQKLSAAKLASSPATFQDREAAEAVVNHLGSRLGVNVKQAVFNVPEDAGPEHDSALIRLRRELGL